MKYGETAPVPIGRAWFITFWLGSKPQDISVVPIMGFFFTFCNWSLKTDSKYYLSFMKTGLLIGNMRVPVGFCICMVGEAHLPLTGHVCDQGLIWLVRMAEDGHNVHHLGSSKRAPACSSHVGQIWCRKESELQEQLMSSNQLDTSEGSRLEKHSNLAKQNKILRYLAKSWVNTTGKYSFD